MFYFKENNLVKTYCKKCSTSGESLGISFNEKHKQKLIGSGAMSDENTSANYDNKCKKCGHVGAQIIDVGVLISDEDQLTLLRCGKCGFTERVGRKTT
jgi:DNA-directed RNA polymerase subunit M/transcription elongation factor TFIIS